MPPSPYFSKTVQHLCSVQLGLPPCCLEFVPYAWGKGQWFVVGTYGLKKNAKVSDETQSRHGTLNLYNMVEEEDKSAKLILVQNVSFPAGIYDLHFLPGSPVFAISTTTGSISIFRIIERPGSQLSIEHSKTHQVFDEEAIVTSFAWYPASNELTSNEAIQGRPLLAATSSNGTITLVRFQNRKCVEFEVISDELDMPVHERYGSSQYAYCCAWSDTVLFSGGDDSYLRMIRLENLPDADAISLTSPAQKFEPHSAGVLAILPIPGSITEPVTTTPHQKRYFLITGGYDDYVRVYGVGGEAKPVVLAELHIGHGVYKMKFLDGAHLSSTSRVMRFKVLASCTNAGVRILEITRSENGSGDGEWGINVQASVTQHRSLCYASDAKPLPHPEETKNESLRKSGSGGIQRSTVVASTSMYDKLLCIWRFREQVTKEEGDGASKLRPYEDLILSEIPDLKVVS